MSERGSTMVSDQHIAEALESLLRESNPNTTLTSLNAVVQQLQSKLGLDLTHKVDFIRAQIHLLFRPQPPQQQQLPFHHKDHFALQQNPNFHPTASHLPPNFPVHRQEEYGFRPPQPPPVVKTEAFVAGVSTNAAAPTAPAAADPEAGKESAQTGKKRRGGPGGLNKLCGVSPELQTIVGQAKLPRTEIVKQLWAYIRKNNLQDPSNKRKIVCNDELRLVFETDCTDMFKMNKLLAKHIIPLEPTKQKGQNSKKMKIEVEPGVQSSEQKIKIEVETGGQSSEQKMKTEVETGYQSSESVPIVIISEALANFFGTGEREMSHPEVLRRVWEYVKVNQLEDPLNSMVILCDAKFQELFGCERISALGIPEMLARHHLYRRS